MKKLLSLILLFSCACNLQAQLNYVKNASFEQHWRCPVFFDQIKFANYWTPIDTINVYPEMGDTFGCPSCTPEYINTCAEGNYDVGAPDNSRFFQFPRTGNGMAQVMVFNNDTEFQYQRDYLQGHLKTHLTTGKNYCVTFFVSFNGNIASISSGYAIDHIGAYLDNGSIDQDTGLNYCGLPKPWITPQVFTASIITDTVNWTKVQGSFVANGTERFITIGNFFDKSHTNYIYIGGSAFSWYLIDDVSVIESTEVAQAGPDVAIVAGDSVHIGTNEDGMPCTWYVAGSSVSIGYSGGIWVKPSITTTYIVEMDLCGTVTRDSVKVTVWPLGTKTASPQKEPNIWPNPATNEMHVDNGATSDVHIYDVVGKEIYKQHISSDKETINLSNLSKGIYIIHIIGPTSGFRATMKVIKE